MKLANEILKVAKCVLSDEKGAIEKVLPDILEELISDKSDDFSVEVSFHGYWAGRHYHQTETSPEEFPEFDTDHEKAVIKDHIQRIDLDEVMERAETELMKVSHNLETSPEELVKSADFMRVLDRVVKSGKWTLEDVHVKLPGGHTTETDLDLKVTIQGGYVVLEATMTHDGLNDILDTVRDKADDWYKQEDYD